MFSFQANWTIDHLIIPAGISFYTFQMVGFTIDTVADRRNLPRFIDFLTFWLLLSSDRGGTNRTERLAASTDGEFSAPIHRGKR